LDPRHCAHNAPPVTIEIELLSNLLDGQPAELTQILQNLLKTISTAMASRGLHQGLKIGLLKRSGNKRTTVVQFKAIKE
jgi:hypothetical protein